MDGDARGIERAVLGLVDGLCVVRVDLVDGIDRVDT
jgi:hypothetical protein